MEIEARLGINKGDEKTESKENPTPDAPAPQA